MGNRNSPEEEKGKGFLVSGRGKIRNCKQQLAFCSSLHLGWVGSKI